MLPSASAERRCWAVVSLAGLLATAVLLLSPLVGSAPVDYMRALSGEFPDKEILFEVRLPRALLAVLAGGALSVAGALLQALLHEPLAAPCTLGVSGGASFGAVLAIWLGWRETGSLPGVCVAACAGAAAALLLVAAIASAAGRVSSLTMLLAGMTVNCISVALIELLHFLADFTQSLVIARWLLGGIESVGYATLAWLCAAFLPLLSYLFSRARELNALAAGEDWAAARGIPTSRLILTGYLAGSLLTGSIVAVTGPISFVGLIVPHAVRTRVGADHRLLLPCCFLLGAAFLVTCDTVSRIVLAPAEVPVGVITAMLGGPFFLWLLRTRRKRS